MPLYILPWFQAIYQASLRFEQTCCQIKGRHKSSEKLRRMSNHFGYQGRKQTRSGTYMSLHDYTAHNVQYMQICQMTKTTFQLTSSTQDALDFAPQPLSASKSTSVMVPGIQNNSTPRQSDQHQGAALPHHQQGAAALSAALVPGLHTETAVQTGVNGVNCLVGLNSCI